jgi:protein phosphatase
MAVTAKAKLDEYRELYSSILKSMQCDVVQVAARQAALKLPTYKADTLISMCQDLRGVFMNEPSMLELSSPLIIVGDLHGQILDLFRILKSCGTPPSAKYLFLGDFVDRGDFSVDVVTLVFVLKVLYPQAVHIIRGNHEFSSVCSTGGFQDECEDLFRTPMVFYAFLHAFEAIPFAALIDKCALTVHGGIGPDVNDISQLRKIERPISEFDDSFIDSLVWSDPCEDINDFEKSHRGTGYLFGEAALKAFIEKNGIKMVIRGHECVEDGYALQFGGKLVTIFSASNYCGNVGNKAAIIILRKNADQQEYRQFPPLPLITRQLIKVAVCIPTVFTSPDKDSLLVESAKIPAPSAVRSGREYSSSTKRIGLARRAVPLRSQVPKYRM